MMPTWAKTTSIGVLGLVVAAALGFLSLQLVSQPVGISSEPLTAGDSLAPISDQTKPKVKKETTSTPSTTKPSNPSSGTDDSATTPSQVQPGSGGDDDSDDHNGGSDDD